MERSTTFKFAFCALIFIICIARSQASNLSEKGPFDSLDARNTDLHATLESTTETNIQTTQQLRSLLDDDTNQRKAVLKAPPPKRRRSPPPLKRKPPPPKSRPTNSPPSPVVVISSPPPPSPSPSPSPDVSTCGAITIDSVTKNFKTCIQMTDRGNRATGTAYFSLSPTQDQLFIGFKASSANYGYLACGYSPNGGMIGTSTVFAQSCGQACAQGFSKTMNGYVYQQFGDSKVAFTDIKAGKDENGMLVGTATMPWPSGKDSIIVMLAAGPVGGGVPQIHYEVPRGVFLKKSDLI